MIQITICFLIIAVKLGQLNPPLSNYKVVKVFRVIKGNNLRNKHKKNF